MQIAIVELLQSCLPKDCLFHHSPNQGERSFAFNAVLKRMGMASGFPDLLFLYQGKAYCIELKIGGEHLSDHQRATHARLQDSRIPVETCRSLSQVWNRLLEWGVPVKPFKEAA